MANTISNIKMTNPLRGLVSKRRKRYQKDGYNLDLAYIQPNLIAMGFPAEKLEGVYRNHIDEVYKFLEHKHSDVYKIYNLCSERSYDCNKFHSRVGKYGFDDHNPPRIELIQEFCNDVHEWLSADPNHVAAVHCKAGKGRTGTMICCFMLHDSLFETAEQALDFYDEKRTHDKKGVTIPSQIRYVEYYAKLLRSGKKYTPIALQICDIILSPPPILNSYQGTVHYSISDMSGKKLYTASVPDFKKSHGNNSDGCISIRLDQCVPLAGDVKVEFYSKTMMRKEKLFHFWFNTYFANELSKETIPSNGDPPNLIYKFKKYELDNAHKDKQDKIYPPDFEVQLILQRIPSGTYPRADNHINHKPYDDTHSPSDLSEASSSESSTEEDGLWESGELNSNNSTTIKTLQLDSVEKFEHVKLKTNTATCNSSNFIITSPTATTTTITSANEPKCSLLKNAFGNDDNYVRITSSLASTSANVHLNKLVTNHNNNSKINSNNNNNNTGNSNINSKISIKLKRFKRKKPKSSKIIPGTGSCLGSGFTPNQQQSLLTKTCFGNNEQTKATSIVIKKKFTKMCSDPDFINTFNNNYRSRNDSCNSLDYYSIICDKQLSYESPKKFISRFSKSNDLLNATVALNPPKSNNISTAQTTILLNNDCTVVVGKQICSTGAIGFNLNIVTAEDGIDQTTEKLDELDNLFKNVQI